jgi:hypothetical protein
MIKIEMVRKGDNVQGGSNITGKNCDLFTHNQSRSYLNYLVPCRKINFSQPEGSRKKRRPGLRWLHSVLKHLQTLEVNVWWKKARDRDLWSEINKEAKAHKGL